MSLLLAAILSCPALPPVPPLVVDPLADELSRFPSREVCVFWYRFGYQHREWLDANTPPLGLVTREERQEWLDYRNKVNFRTDTWLCLIQAWDTEIYEVSTRRRWLDDLRWRLGDDWFIQGYLPLPLDLNKMWSK